MERFKISKYQLVNIETQFRDADIINDHFADGIPQIGTNDSVQGYYKKNRMCNSEFRFCLVPE